MPVERNPYPIIPSAVRSFAPERYCGVEGPCVRSQHDECFKAFPLRIQTSNYATAQSALKSPAVQKNQLYYGDNLEVLRQHIKDESVDLIYLDPPFNSRQDYNVLFTERACHERSRRGTRSSSQIMAFEDTWKWNVDAERAYEEIVEQGGRVSDAMRAFRSATAT
jgi:16S rRNA G966 N2-methylase RsmD